MMEKGCKKEGILRGPGRTVGQESNQKGAPHMARYSQTSAQTQDRFLPKGKPFSQRRRRRSRRLLPLTLLGLLLFGGGFLLGGTQAATPLPQSEEQAYLPEQTFQEPLVSAENPDPPAQTSDQADADSWELLLVNADHPLPEDFQVPELTALRGGHAIDSRAYPSLQQMMDDCRAAGLEPAICSSYRTRAKQEELFEKKLDTLLQQGYAPETAEKEAARWVARPGTSEHETALAVDIVDTSYQILDEKQEQTPVQQWLMEHCAEYGFILRYPTDKSDLTGIGYEPWHYRYVGTEAAAAITAQHLCLEEYLMEDPV